MAVLKAFKGIRPRPDLANKIASFPYDVVNSEEAREIASGNALSFLHVVKPEIDLDPGIDVYSDAVYAKGRENLDRLIADGNLIQDNAPRLYLYQQQMGNHIQTGLVGCTSVADYENDIIRKHEHTREVKERDRIRHVDTLNANTGPVFLTYRNKQEIDALVNGFIKANDPVYDFSLDDGIRHIFWVVEDEDLIQRFEKAFEGIDYLYVADGHHRSASAAKVGAMRRNNNPGHTGEEEYNFFLSVLFPDNQLKILDYNRVVKDLNGNDPKGLIAKLESAFEVEPQEAAYKPTAKHTFGMYLEGRWYKLTARPGSWDDADPVARLDVAILANKALGPILGIGDPRKDERIDFVGGIRGLKELEKRVNSGEMAVAFSMFPTSIEDLMAIADSGQVMPPKSTWFEPKLRSGLIVHKLDD